MKGQKKLYQKLKRDDKSILFGEESINNLFENLKKSKYVEDKEFVILLDKLER